MNNITHRNRFHCPVHTSVTCYRLVSVAVAGSSPAVVRAVCWRRINLNAYSGYREFAVIVTAVACLYDVLAPVAVNCAAEVGAVAAVLAASAAVVAVAVVALAVVWAAAFVAAEPLVNLVT